MHSLTASFRVEIYAFIIYPKRATCLDHLILLLPDFITLLVCGKHYRSHDFDVLVTVKKTKFVTGVEFGQD